MLMILLRRFAVVCALSLWMGGFTFYSSFVIPVATEQLGSAREAGFITAQVTQALNVCGVVALVILGWNAAMVWREMGRRERHLLGWTLSLLVVAEVTLLTLHPLLEARLRVPTRGIRPGTYFFALHQVYLWISSVQWFVALAHVGVILAIWRRQDRATPSIATPE